MRSDRLRLTWPGHAGAPRSLKINTEQIVWPIKDDADPRLYQVIRATKFLGKAKRGAGNIEALNVLYASLALGAKVKRENSIVLTNFMKNV